MRQFSRTKRLTRHLRRTKTCMRLAVALIIVVVLLVFMLIFSRRAPAVPPSVHIAGPTHAQLLHIEEEKRLNQALISALEQQGLSERVAQLRERPTRFRVFTIETRLNLDLCQMAATSALTGVHVPVVAHDSKPGYITRFEYMLQYIEDEKLADDDILYVHDSDVLYVGEDLIPHLVEFGLYAPPSPADVDVAAVRAYDDYGEDKAPDVLAAIRHTPRETHTYHASAIRFALEQTCMSWSAIRMPDCHTAQSYVQSAIEAARNRNDVGTMNRTLAPSPFADGTGDLVDYVTTRMNRNVTLYDALNNYIARSPFRTTTQRSNAAQSPFAPNFGDDERLRFRPNYNGELEPGFLNAGVFTARVWALRHVLTALHEFARTHRTLVIHQESGKNWWCDQSIFGMLHMLTRTWEAEQGLLHSVAPSLRSPFAENPNRLLPGVLGIETYTKTVFLLNPELSPKGKEFAAYLTRVPNTGDKHHLATKMDRGLAGHYKEFKAQLRKTRAGASLAPPMFRPAHSPNDDILERARHYCATPDRCPILLHFPGINKTLRMRHLLPRTELLFPALVDPESARVVRDILDATLIELHTSKGRMYKRFYDVCNSPK